MKNISPATGPGSKPKMIKDTHKNNDIILKP